MTRPAGGRVADQPAGAQGPELATYASDSACAGVQVATPVARVPAACAAAWTKLGVTLVPGQDLVRDAPRPPQVRSVAGASVPEVTALIVAFWRTEAFKAFAIKTKQPGIVDGLGANRFFRDNSLEVQGVVAGADVPAPDCHEYPAALGVARATPTLARFLKKTGTVLLIKATYSAPCAATATAKDGSKVPMYSWTSPLSVLYEGEIAARRDPLGSVLQLTGLAECTQQVALDTCAQ
jgi:hypothetical protein